MKTEKSILLKVTGDSLQRVESQFTKIIDSNVGWNEKLKQFFSSIAEGHVKKDLLCWLSDSKCGIKRSK